MGLFKMLLHSKEMDELEEVLKLLLNRIKVIYNGRVKETSYLGRNLLFYEEYGYGKLMQPRTDISFSEDIIDKINEHQAMTHCQKRLLIIKRDDYNQFCEMSAEFTHKANRYIQLLQKAEISMPMSIRNLIKTYKGMLINFHYSYKYVVG